MILTTLQLVITIAIMAILTFMTRVIPFIIFPANKKTPDYIHFLGEVLPFAIIGMLIVYCLKAVSFISFPFDLPELIAIVFIIILHLWKNSTLLSISGGTLLYMFLVQMIFI